MILSPLASSERGSARRSLSVHHGSVSMSCFGLAAPEGAGTVTEGQTYEYAEHARDDRPARRGGDVFSRPGTVEEGRKKPAAARSRENRRSRKQGRDDSGVFDR